MLDFLNSPAAISFGGFFVKGEIYEKVLYGRRGDFHNMHGRRSDYVRLYQQDSSDKLQHDYKFLR